MLSDDIAWRPATLRDTDRWIHVLSAAEKRDLHDALRHAQESGVTGCADMSKEDFPLTVLPATLHDLLNSLENDLGLYVLRGLPVEDYTKDELRLLFWGIGLHLGTAVTQSAKGDILGDVRNFGQHAGDQLGRGYMAKDGLGFHTDTSDIVGLFVLRTARSGGESLFCSSVAIRDELAEQRPDLHEVLTQPFYWSWKENLAIEGRRAYEQPIYTYAGRRFASRYIKTHILSAQEFPEVPRLTSIQDEAMLAIDTRATDPRFHYRMMFEPGDLQFLNNHVIYHARTQFEDFQDEDRKRHLLRIWLSAPNTRPLSPAMSAIFRDQRAGAVRGGFPSRAANLSYETVPVASSPGER